MVVAAGATIHYKYFQYLILCVACYAIYCITISYFCINFETEQRLCVVVASSRMAKVQRLQFTGADTPNNHPGAQKKNIILLWFSEKNYGGDRRLSN